MRLGVDIGGTFTDVVVFDEEQHAVALAKVLTTPAALAQGVQEGLTKTAIPLGAASCLIHGSTIVVNAVLERRGAKTALVTTRGFRDIYEIGRINRPESFHLRFRKHRSLVPRELVFEVPERMRADGTELTPLDADAARQVAQILKDEGIEAVAVVFLHSYRVPQHEVRMCEILHETDAHWFITASHELSREYREYERTSTTVANAYVGPIVSTYLGDLEQGLAHTGFHGSLMIMQSNGGLQDVETARRQCIQMMESGPAGGVVGTMAVCEALDLEAAIAFDMGGTTAKACVIRRGAPSLARCAIAVAVRSRPSRTPTSSWAGSRPNSSSVAQCAWTVRQQRPPCASASPHRSAWISNVPPPACWRSPLRPWRMPCGT